MGARALMGKLYKKPKQKKFKGKKHVGAYVRSGLSLEGLKDYWLKVQKESGGTYGQAPGSYEYKGKTGKGFLNWDAKKKVAKAYKKTAEYKAWKKAGGTAVRTQGYDAEGNRALLGSGTAKYDRHDAWHPDSQAGFSRARDTAYEKSGSDIRYSGYNAADRWFENYTSGLSKEEAIEQNPYGKGKLGYDAVRARYGTAKAKSTTDKEDRSFAAHQAKQAEIKSGATRATNAPAQGATSALGRAAATNTTTVVTPKEPRRKAVPHVSRRIKQKQANRGAGIRT